MGMIHIFERSGDDARRFDESMKRAKSGLMEACEIWEDMKEQFSERGGMGERGGYSQHGGYGERMRRRDDYEERYRDDMSERSRDSRGRWI